MPLLFEVRVASALHRLGIRVSYEHRTGSGQRSADFRVQGKPEWLIEAVRLGESDAMKAATKRSGNGFSLNLSSAAGDEKQSEEGEVIKAMERIAEKACKFPKPRGARFHVVLVDVRGYLDGGDHDDYKEMAYGTGAPRPENRHWWRGEPVLGLFDLRNARHSARLVQQRVHLLGFIAERMFCEGEIQNIGFYLPNPGLLAGREAAAQAFQTYPLRQV
jgi:hypothetical protein